MDKTARIMAALVTGLIALFLAACAVCLVFAPWIVMRLEWYFGNRLTTLIGVYAGGLAGVWLLVEMLLIMRTVYKGEPFVMSNVRSLKCIAASCGIAAAAIIFIVCFMTRSSLPIALMICAAILLFGMICAVVLALVFRRAVQYKAENDLTV